MSMLDRSIQSFDSKGNLVSESFRNVEWDEVRKERIDFYQYLIGVLCLIKLLLKIGWISEFS